MLNLFAGTKQFAVQGVVLDKDGTLLDLHQAWGPRTVTWIRNLARAAGGPAELAHALFKIIGYDAKNGRAIPDGPFISANESTLVTLTAGVLNQNGYSWNEAVSLALATSQDAYAKPLESHEVQPLGDVAGTVRRLRRAGVPVAVATADARATTLQSLDFLGIRAEVDLVICGDDPLPQKPDAAVLAWIADAWNCRPDQLLMVGDSLADMLTGRNGGAAGTVAIVPPGMPLSPDLQRHADAILSSIAELQWKDNL